MRGECSLCNAFGKLIFDETSDRLLCQDCTEKAAARRKAAEAATLPLFPDIEAERDSDALAAFNEHRQRAFDYLGQNPGYVEFIRQELTNGPEVDVNLMLRMGELATMEQGLKIAAVLLAMWVCGTIWRRPFHNHPSGEECFWVGLVAAPGIYVRYPKPGDAVDFKL